MSLRTTKVLMVDAPAIAWHINSRARYKLVVVVVLLLLLFLFLFLFLLLVWWWMLCNVSSNVLPAGTMAVSWPQASKNRLPTFERRTRGVSASVDGDDARTTG